MVADFEILFLSLSVLVSFLLWRRLVPGWVALALTVVVFLPGGVVPKSSAQLYPTWSFDWSEQGWVMGPVVFPVLGLAARF